MAILLQQHSYEKALEVAHMILQSNDQNGKSLEAICQIFVEDASAPLSTIEVAKAIEDLSTTNANNKYAMMAKAAILLRSGSVLEAKGILETVLSKHKTPSCLSLLYDVYIQLGYWKKAEETCLSAQGFDLNALESYQWAMKVVRSLLEQPSREKLQETNVILDTWRPEKQLDPPFQILQALYFVKMNETDSLVAILATLEEQKPVANEPLLVIIKSSYLQQTDRIEEALQLLEENCDQHPDNVELQFSLAKMLWQSGSRLKSVGHLLNVVKINRDMAEAYVLLGTFYSQQTSDASNLHRGVRCMEKAFQLEPQNVETARKLLDLYRRMSDSSSAIKLLDVVIKCNPRDCRWAWTEKGSLHLKVVQDNDGAADDVLAAEKEATLAIGCLQNALRTDAGDVHCWQLLGEAYALRGSYTAALKAFEKVVELDSECVYSSYQIANIKQKLGEHEEAIAAYSQLLTREPNHVPSLKGLAETLLSRAGLFEADGFVGRLVDDCVSALKVLVRAARLEAQRSCLWSLMGQVCLTMRVVPQLDFSFRCPTFLIENHASVEGNDDQCPASKKQLMQLAVRCYSVAIKLLPNSPNLWFNLALSYDACRLLADVQDPQTYQPSAIAAVKKAITLDPGASTYWNLLGLMTDEPAVSQHWYF